MDSRSSAPMNDIHTANPTSAAWSNLFRDGRGLYTALVLGGVFMQALQVQVISIIMPTVVGDIGGAAYYTWAAMTYTVGTIIGTASLGPLWTRFGQRAGYALAGLAFLAGTIACAMAPDMATLIVARAVQGYGGGLIAGGAMALIGTLFEERLRPRILAMYQGCWTTSHLCGPVVGGLLAEIGWWRGSFWVVTPLILAFSVFAWTKLPDRPAERSTRAPSGPFPVRRLAVLAGGVIAIAAAGPVSGTALRVALVAGGTALLWLAFRLDRGKANRLFPTGAFAFRAPLGVAIWIQFIGGAVQTAYIVFLPLLLQIVHGVTPMFVSFVNMTISFGWTVGSFGVSGWSGRRERLALLMGPPLILVGGLGMAATAQLPVLAVTTVAAFVLGVGMGIHTVPLVARTMATAMPGEERITASAMPTIRSLGVACGAAIAGLLSSVAGLGETLDPQAVGGAVTFVYGCQLAPSLVMTWLMFRLVRIGMPKA